MIKEHNAEKICTKRGWCQRIYTCFGLQKDKLEEKLEE